MTPKIVTLSEKSLIGMSLEMSLTDNKTFDLFSGFMPEKKNIANIKSSDVYEVMLYNSNHFKQFNPTNTFTKWASVEVSNLDNIPNNMNSYLLEGGLYAVFHYKGLAQDFGQLMRYILMEWLPSSGYLLDQRAHFNVLGDKYKKNHPESEEDVWIPIKPI